MSIVPAQITAGEDAFALVKALTEWLESHNQANFEANAYSEANKKLGTPGFAVPPEVAGRIAPVTGAPGIVVDGPAPELTEEMKALYAKAFRP